MTDTAVTDGRLGKRMVAETKLRRFELRVERAIKKILDAHQQHAIKSLRSQHVVAAAPPDSFGIYSWDTAIDDQLLPELGDVLGDVATGITNFLDLPPEMRAQVLGAIDVQGRAANFADKVRTISTDIAPRLNETLAVGIGKGEGIVKLTARINDVFGTAYNIAERIARTETHGAVENTQWDSAHAIGDAGVEMTKEWLATSDQRTRETHGVADGQLVGMDEPFTVGDSELMFPGDDSLGADASEVINCRCTCLYDVAPGVGADTSGDQPDMTNDFESENG